MSSYASSRIVSSRASSVSVDSKSRAPSQALDIGEGQRPPLPPSKRWSSVLEYGPGSFVSSRASSVTLDSKSRFPSQALDIGEGQRPTQPPSKRRSSVLEHGSGSFVSSRASSVTLESKSRAPFQALDIGEGRRPTLPPSMRRSSVHDQGSGRPVHYENYVPTSHMPRANTPSYPTYHEALVKSSQRLRERSMSPSVPAPVNVEKYSPYKCNMDYYRGKVKSVYEKEPIFKDFVRNIPLSESNLYDNNNLSQIKRRFNTMLEGKRGKAQTPDPFNPSGNITGIFHPVSETLARKHKSIPPAPAALPFIHVYHRNSRR